MPFSQGFRELGIEPLLKQEAKQASRQASKQAIKQSSNQAIKQSSTPVPSKPGRATVVFADYAPTNHLGSGWHLSCSRLEDYWRSRVV
jgi:hypothetical protein